VNGIKSSLKVRFLVLNTWEKDFKISYAVGTVMDQAWSHHFELSYEPINYNVGLFSGIHQLTELSSWKLEDFTINRSVFVEPFTFHLKRLGVEAKDF
jgi:hypothetical protein